MTLFIYMCCVYLYISCVICLECPQNSCRLRSLNPSSLSKHSTSGLPPAAPCKEQPHLSEDNPCQTKSETSSYPPPSAPNVPLGKTCIRVPIGLRLYEFFQFKSGMNKKPFTWQNPTSLEFNLNRQF